MGVAGPGLGRADRTPARLAWFAGLLILGINPRQNWDVDPYEQFTHSNHWAAGTAGLEFSSKLLAVARSTLRSP